MEELYGVFYGNDVLRHRAVDQVRYRRERRGLAAPDRPRDEDDATLLLSEADDNRRQIQILEFRYTKRDEKRMTIEIEPRCRKALI